MKKKHTRSEIKAHLIQLKENEIKRMEEVAKTYSKDADLDEESVIDADDLSHQSQSTDAARNIYLQIEEANNQIADFKKMHPENTNEISEGSIVITNKINMVIGLSFKDFEWNGERFVGISTQAPIYQALMGKKEKDIFDFNGVDYVIEQIL